MDPGPAMQSFLRALVEAGGSDLHLKAGSPPRIRVPCLIGFRFAKEIVER